MENENLNENLADRFKRFYHRALNKRDIFSDVSHLNNQWQKWVGRTGAEGTWKDLQDFLSDKNVDPEVVKATNDRFTKVHDEIERRKAAQGFQQNQNSQAATESVVKEAIADDAMVSDDVAKAFFKILTAQLVRNRVRQEFQKASQASSGNQTKEKSSKKTKNQSSQTNNTQQPAQKQTSYQQPSSQPAMSKEERAKIDKEALNANIEHVAREAKVSSSQLRYFRDRSLHTLGDDDVRSLAQMMQLLLKRR